MENDTGPRIEHKLLSLKDFLPEGQARYEPPPKTMTMRTNVNGFSLFDLVIVIGILAITVVFAFPKFDMLQVEARRALVLSMGGAVNSAALQAHYLWILQGKPAFVTMDGHTVDMADGYPDTSGIEAALMDYSGFQYHQSGKAPVVRFRKLGAADLNNCLVRYDEADSGQRPNVTVYTSGC